MTDYEMRVIRRVLGISGALRTTKKSNGLLSELRSNTPEKLGTTNMLRFANNGIKVSNRDFAFTLNLIKNNPDKFTDWDKDSSDFLVDKFEEFGEELAFGAGHQKESEARWARIAEKIDNAGHMPKDTGFALYALATSANPTLRGRKLHNLLSLEPNSSITFDDGAIEMKRENNVDSLDFLASYHYPDDVDMLNYVGKSFTEIIAHSGGQVFSPEHGSVNLLDGKRYNGILSDKISLNEKDDISMLIANKQKEVREFSNKFFKPLSSAAQEGRTV